MFDPDIHHRRSIRLKDYDYSQTGAYFVTICVRNRECLMGDVIDGKMILNDFGEIVLKCWKDIPNHFPHVSLNEYVIMPNHIHGIIVIQETDPVVAIHELPLQTTLGIPELSLQTNNTRRRMILPQVIGYFKMNSAKKINQLRKTHGI